MRYLIAGAGVIGCYTAAMMKVRDFDVTLLARGAKHERLQRDGVQLLEYLTDRRWSVNVPVVNDTCAESFDTVLVFVQAIHVDGILPVLERLPRAKRYAFMGNNTRGFERVGEALGRSRVLSGFGSAGGTWRDDLLVYVDATTPEKQADPRLILGAPFAESIGEIDPLVSDLRAGRVDVTVYDPIQDWHLAHAAFIAGLAGAFRRCGNDLHRLADDRATLDLTLRATKQAFRGLRRSGHEILPRSLRTFGALPLFLIRPKVRTLLRSKFAEIGLAGHAETAHDEMQTIRDDVLELVSASGVRCDALRELAA